MHAVVRSKLVVLFTLFIHILILIKTDAVLAQPPVRFDAPRSYVTDPFPLQVIPMDLDDDGDFDAAVLCAPVLNQPRLHLFENPGDGALIGHSQIPLSADTRLARADLNGDNRPDLVQAYSEDGLTGAVNILLRTGPFAFSSSTRTLSFPGSRLCIGDLDGRNGPDLIIGDDMPGPHIQVLYADGAGGHGPPVSYQVEDEFRDVNGDGFPEVQIPVNVRDCACADMNGDGSLDVVITNSIQRKMSDSGENIYTTDIVLLLNDGTGALLPYQPVLDWGGDRLGIGDIEGDNDLDIVSVGAAAQGGDGVYKLLVLANNGAAQFAAPQWYAVGGGVDSVWGPVLADVDGDGDLDAGLLLPGMMAGDSSDHPTDHWALLRNSGLGRFALPQIHPTGADIFDLAFFDLDGADGPDALTVAGDDDRLVVDYNRGGWYALPRTISIDDPRHPAYGNEAADLVAGDFNNDSYPELAALAIVSGIAGDDNGDVVALLPGGPGGPVQVASWLDLNENPWRLHAESIAGSAAWDLGAVFLGDSLFGAPMGVGLTIGMDQQPPAAMQFITLPDMPSDLTAVEVTGDGIQDLAVLRSRTHEGFAAGLAIVEVSATGGLNHLGDLLLGSDDILQYDSRLTEVITAADMDGDGQEDIVAVTWNVFESWHRIVTVIRNDGNLQFWLIGEYYVNGGETVDILAAEVTGDLLPDIILVTAPESLDTDDPGYLWVLPNLGGGMLGEAVAYNVGQYPVQVAAARIDGDAHPDLVIACDGSNEVTILFNDGQGGFPVQERYVPGGGSDAVTVGDFDGDGDLDIAVANDNHGMTERHATVSMLFNRFIAAAAVPGDLDHDGDVDGQDLSLWRQCACGPRVPHPVFPLCLNADFDGDGDVDQIDFGILQRSLSGG